MNATCKHSGVRYYMLRVPNEEDPHTRQPTAVWKCPECGKEKRQRLRTGRAWRKRMREENVN